jgi:prepilin-type N-terminal cleavage/methylation domain-containing protein
MHHRKHPTRRSERGFSALELIVAIIVIGILAAASVFAFNSDNAKATTLYSVSQDYAGALTRAKTELGCYPNKMAALFDRTQANTSFCGADLTATWNGRYAAQAPVDAAGNILLNNIAPGAVVTLVNVVDAAGTHWQVQVTNVPNGVLTRAVTLCNSGAPPGPGQKCVGAAGAGGSGTFSLEFDLT